VLRASPRATCCELSDAHFGRDRACYTDGDAALLHSGGEGTVSRPRLTLARYRNSSRDDTSSRPTDLLQRYFGMTA